MWAYKEPLVVVPLTYGKPLRRVISCPEVNGETPRAPACCRVPARFRAVKTSMRALNVKVTGHQRGSNGNSLAGCWTLGHDLGRVCSQYPVDLDRQRHRLELRVFHALLRENAPFNGEVFQHRWTEKEKAR